MITCTNIYYENKKYLNKLYNMNSNNKFGICCKCPAISNITREFTVWSSSRIYNYDLMKKNKLNNANSFRSLLQSNGEDIIKNKYNDFENNFKCVNNGNNIFYIDSSKFNDYYNNLNNVSQNVELQDYYKKLLTKA